ncbi:MAG TPA: respiratory nitrate reductase subunit gamma [Acidiferrobacter sp.]|nr:respiratory nitrate reductase subunit gamma [Acidiferrobacter sp.]
MSAWTIGYAVLLYVALVVLVGGLSYRIAIYTMTPAPLRIPTMPAPRTRAGVAVRMAGEVGLFTSLFRGDKWAWIWSYLFHVSLLLVLLQHLRYVLNPVPWWVRIESPFGSYAAFVLVASLIGLFGRRLAVARVRFVSGPSDYLMLLLLLAIGITGGMMRFQSPVDIISLKAFILGLMYLHLQPLPAAPLILVHIALVASLMVVLPFSKLLHAPGVFFSPTRNQADRSRLEPHGPSMPHGSSSMSHEPSVAGAGGPVNAGQEKSA